MNPNSKHLAGDTGVDAASTDGSRTSRLAGRKRFCTLPRLTRLSAAQRLAIYQRGYFARLLQCLEGQYKALCHALGKELFDDFSKEYLRKYPIFKPYA
jgi:hypothetical protein